MIYAILIMDFTIAPALMLHVIDSLKVEAVLPSFDLSITDARLKELMKVCCQKND